MKKKLLLIIICSIFLVACGISKEDDSVQSYLENSRKAAYIDTVVTYSDYILKEVNMGKTFRLYKTDTLYLIPVGNKSNYSCINPESNPESPYSDKWNYAYVGVIYYGKGYTYYIIAEDGAGNGLLFNDKKSVLDNDITLLYMDSSKIKSSGYDILYKQYNQIDDNTIYEESGQNSSDYKKLANIMNTKDDKYNRIIIIGSKDCKYIDNI